MEVYSEQDCALPMAFHTCLSGADVSPVRCPGILLAPSLQENRHKHRCFDKNETGADEAAI
jgi:hypothetical protein